MYIIGCVDVWGGRVYGDLDVVVSVYGGRRRFVEYVVRYLVLNSYWNF